MIKTTPSTGSARATALREVNGAEGTLPLLPSRLALLELGAFALVVALELFWAPFPDLTRLSPHPYWLPVLLLSLQYGTVSGLLAAVVAVLGNLLIGLPSQDIGETYFAYLIRASAEPVLWIVAALLLGTFRVRQIEQHNELMKRADDATAQAGVLKAYADDLEGRCAMLERHLAGGAEMNTDRVFAVLARLGAAEDLDQRRTLAQTALALAYPDAEVSVAACDPSGARVVLTSRWSPTARWRRAWPAGDPLIRALVEARRALSIQRTADEHVLSGEGIAAVPIVAPSLGVVVGWIKIETCPAEKINPDTIDKLAALARHLWPIVTAVNAIDQRGDGAPAKAKPVASLLRTRLTRVLAGRETTRDAAE